MQRDTLPEMATTLSVAFGKHSEYIFRKEIDSFITTHSVAIKKHSEYIYREDERTLQVPCSSVLGDCTQV